MESHSSADKVGKDEMAVEEDNSEDEKEGINARLTGAHESNPLKRDRINDGEVDEARGSSQKKDSTKDSGNKIGGECELDSGPSDVKLSEKDEIREEVDAQKRKKRNQKRIQHRLEKAEKDKMKGYQEDTYKEDYDMWVPPQNQTGDGKTNLNDKFGY